MRIRARKIVELSQAQVNELLTGNFTLIFDDGDLETGYKDVIYSSYVWEVHRQFPGAPITKSHHLSSILNGSRLSSGTHLKFISRVLWDVYMAHASFMDEQSKLTFRYKLAKLAYEITNNIYNDMMLLSEEYVGSLDITDFHEVLNHPEIQAAYDRLPPVTADINSLRVGIEGVYSSINRVLNDKSILGHNPLSALTRSNLVNSKQLNQCLGPRGFLTDTDSDTFIRPVLRGYVEGLRLFYNTLVESRSAAKSLEFSKSPLQDSEYFARRLQLICMGVENLHQEDCGTGKYVRWTVAGEEVINGIKVYAGDLKNLVGKHYLDEETGQLKTIKASDKHLIGQTIHIRSVLKCQHPDPKGVCAVCFGQLSESVPPNSNLGHMCGTYMSQQASQMILSVKHLDGSSVVEAIVLRDGDRTYLKVLEDGKSLTIADNLKKGKVYLIIPNKNNDKPVNLSDIYNVEDVRDLILSRVSELTQVGVMYIDADGEIHESEDGIDVYMDRRMASLTYEMLEHIRNVGWMYDDYGNYKIDLTGWDMDKPILELPLKQFNMSDHSNAIAAMLEGTVKDQYKRDKIIPPEAMLHELFTLVNRRLSVNLAALEVVLYAAMVVSSTEGNYELPKPWTDAGVGVMEKTMAGRSESASMAYQNHFDIVTDPASFINTNRPEHPFDMILMPREVVEYSEQQHDPNRHSLSSSPPR